MMTRFLECDGQVLRLLLQDDDGAWLIDYDSPAQPFWVDREKVERMTRIPTPEEFTLSMRRELQSEAELERLHLIQPLLDNELFIKNKKYRLAAAREIAVENHTTTKRVLRIYYRYLATGVLLKQKERSPRKQPDYDWAIRTFYFSSKRLSLRATYDLMLLQRYTDASGTIVDGAPTWSSFRHYFYQQSYHKRPQKIIAREGLSHYQRNHRPVFGSSSNWRPIVGSYQMDATEADIYLVSRFDRSSVIGRPYIYMAVDTATQLIAGIYVGMEAGEGAVMACLAQAASDKVEYCQRYGIEITESQWPSRGMPSEVITDKGRDFISKRIQELCLRYGVEIQSLPPFRPDAKGLVEKAFDLLQQRYKPLLRGRGVIEPDAQERWATDYRGQAVLDLDDFTQIVIHCVVFLNSGRLLSCGKTPAQLWAETENKLLMVEPTDLHCMALPRTLGKLTRKGIHYNGLVYAPDEVDRFLIGDTYTLAVDHNDSSRIYIVQQGEYYCCPLAGGFEQFKGLSESEVVTAKKTERQEIRRAEKEEVIARITAVQNVQKVIDQAVEHTCSSQRRQSGIEIQANKEAERRKLT